jgi:hypothetical protein
VKLGAEPILSINQKAGMELTAAKIIVILQTIEEAAFHAEEKKNNANLNEGLRPPR